MNRMLAFGIAVALSIALLPQGSPGAEAEEKKTKTQKPPAKNQGLTDLSQQDQLNLQSLNKKKAKGVNQKKAKGVKSQ